MIDLRDKPEIKQIGRTVISDDELKMELVAFVKENRDWLEKEPQKSFTPELNVYWRHGVGEKLKKMKIVLIGYPPPKGATVDRFDVMQNIGKMYFEKMVEKKPKGEKCMPVMVFMATEAWGRAESKEDAEKRISEGKWLEEMENKDEVFMISGMTVDGRTNRSITNIMRDKNGYIYLGKTINLHYENKEVESSDFLIENFYIGFTRAMNEVVWE